MTQCNRECKSFERINSHPFHIPRFSRVRALEQRLCDSVSLTSLNSLLGAAMAFSCTRYEAQHHDFFLPLYETTSKTQETAEMLE